jgi:hypothetical protein
MNGAQTLRCRSEPRSLCVIELLHPGAVDGMRLLVARRLQKHAGHSSEIDSPDSCRKPLPGMHDQLMLMALIGAIVCKDHCLSFVIRETPIRQ